MSRRAASVLRHLPGLLDYLRGSVRLAALIRPVRGIRPGGTALTRFGFTGDDVVERALAVLHREHVDKARMLRTLSA